MTTSRLIRAVLHDEVEIQLKFQDCIPVAALFAYDKLPEGFKTAMAQIITAYNNSARFTAGESNDPTETYDQKVFQNTLLTFGQCPYIVTEQAAIRGLEMGMPHGNIDLLAGSESPSGTASSSYVLCMLASSKVYTTLTEPNSTTVKTPTTFDMLSSDRQAVLEILASSAVLTVDDDLPVILLKASRSEILPFFYFPKLDVLLKCKTSFEYGGVVGAMLLYMLLRPNVTMSRNLAKVLSQDIGSHLSGWKESLEKSGMEYFKVISPQKSSEAITKEKSPSNDRYTAEVKSRWDEWLKLESALQGESMAEESLSQSGEDEEDMSGVSPTTGTQP